MWAIQIARELSLLKCSMLVLLDSYQYAVLVGYSTVAANEQVATRTCCYARGRERESDYPLHREPTLRILLLKVGKLLGCRQHATYSILRYN